MKKKNLLDCEKRFSKRKKIIFAIVLGVLLIAISFLVFGDSDSQRVQMYWTAGKGFSENLPTLVLPE